MLYPITRNTVDNHGMTDIEIIFVEDNYFYGQNFVWFNEETNKVGFVDDFGNFINVENNYFGHGTCRNKFNADLIFKSDKPVMTVIIKSVNSTITVIRQLAHVLYDGNFNLESDYIGKGHTSRNVYRVKSDNEFKLPKILVNELKTAIISKFNAYNVVFKINSYSKG